MNKFIDGMTLCDELERAILSRDLKAASKFAARLREIAEQLDAASGDPPIMTAYSAFIVRAIKDGILESARRAVEILQIMLAEEVAEIGSA